MMKSRGLILVYAIIICGGTIVALKTFDTLGESFASIHTQFGSQKQEKLVRGFVDKKYIDQAGECKIDIIGINMASKKMSMVTVIVGASEYEELNIGSFWEGSRSAYKIGRAIFIEPNELQQSMLEAM